MAPCGLYCGACAVYIATRDNNEKFKAVPELQGAGGRFFGRDVRA
ncbi:MAG TPA: DUF3795 domain-containing protein [Desulfosalsimonadaceae bacterium]|nr:DUF3795 domain-containing protein [Desulfosalsimonadaceae bacterium]